MYVTEGDELNFDSYGPMSRFFTVDAAAGGSGELTRSGAVHSSGSTVTVSFLGLDVKNVNVNVIASDYIVPCGNTVGIKIYAGGLMVLRIASFEAADGSQARPWAGTGIKKGDIIRKANGQAVDSINQFAKIVDSLKGDSINLEIQRGSAVIAATLAPQLEKTSGRYKVGIVVRDSMAGIGTLTYYSPASGTFGALGHPIEDGDTGIVFPLAHGSLEQAEVINVVKGRRGMPGEIHGMFAGKEPIGTITDNCAIGVYGKADKAQFDLQNAIPAASRSQVKEGAATLQCTVTGNGVQQYDIEIEKILHAGNDSSKGMVVHITDNDLIAATGGIVQGMSGSPIIQNGRIVGAVTHVFVNDPTRGYGIFIENMLAEVEKIK